MKSGHVEVDIRMHIWDGIRMRLIALLSVLPLVVACPAKESSKTEKKAVPATVASKTATAASKTAAAASKPAVAPKLDGKEIGGGTMVKLTGSVGFTGANIAHTHKGAFERWSGTVVLNGDDVTKATITVEIDMSSVKTNSEKLDGHLKSPDFFDVANHPKGLFTSTKIEAADGGHTVTGQLTLRGKTQTVSFPAKIAVSKEAVKASATLTIDRMKFDIKYPGKADDLIKDNVDIVLEVAGQRG